MNIYDIAKMSGVSTATVSRVINGGPVSRQTRARVNAVLEKTGYQPSPYAQGMNLGSMKLVGILVSQIDDLFYMRAVSILEQRLREMGYDFILYSVGEEMKNKDVTLPLFAPERWTLSLRWALFFTRRKRS